MIKERKSRLQRIATAWNIFCLGMYAGALLFGAYLSKVGVIEEGELTFMHMWWVGLGFVLAVLPCLLVEIFIKVKALRKTENPEAQNKASEDTSQ